MRRARAVVGAGALALLAALAGGAFAAQDRGATERKLETVKRELKSVADERRKLEGARGDASRRLRQVDEQVGQSTRSLRETEQRLGRDQAALAGLQQQRDALQLRLGGQREERARLLRAAYAQGDAAPLKALLAQDSVAEGNRMLAYHGYLQRDRAARIAGLSRELAALDTLERQIVERRAALAGARTQQQQQLVQLEHDRKARATLVAELDHQYQDRRQREAALGRDAKGLEQLLRKLRAAAARAEAQRKAEAARANATASTGKSANGGRKGTATPRRPTAVASAPPQVGGMGWPASGALLAGFGASMPDGRRSEGLLIGANAGANVSAVADGDVVYAEWMTGYGLLIIVDHGNGYMSLYAHNDALLRNAGERVRRGQAIATVGSSGGHGRPALYFELRRNGQPVNPGVWLRR